MTWDPLNGADISIRYQKLVFQVLCSLSDCQLPDILEQKFPTSKVFADASLEKAMVMKELRSRHLFCENWNL